MNKLSMRMEDALRMLRESEEIRVCFARAHGVTLGTLRGLARRGLATECEEYGVHFFKITQAGRFQSNLHPPRPVWPWAVR